MLSFFTFLLDQPRVNVSDYVEVSSLPHPISMFMIGVLLVLVIFLFILYNKLKETTNELKSKMKNQEEEKQKILQLIDVKLSEVSKKLLNIFVLIIVE